LNGDKVNDDSVSFDGIIFSVFDRGRAGFTIGVKPTFATVSVTHGRTALQRSPLVYVKGTDLATGTVMESEPQLVHLATHNRTVCPVGLVLVLDTSTGSDSLRPGACTACAVGEYNVNPLTGLCLPCPASATCINGAPPLFGAKRVTGTVEIELPDDAEDDLQHALAVKLDVEAWQLTVLPQQRGRRSMSTGGTGQRFTCPSYWSDRHARATLDHRHYTYLSRPDDSSFPSTTDDATAQRRRKATVSFELVAGAAQMAELRVSLAALGLELGEPASLGAELMEGEVWKEVEGRFLLRACPLGHQLINTTEDGVLDLGAQKCIPCGPSRYIVDPRGPWYCSMLFCLSLLQYHAS
jgi:hypothetical protein